MKQLTIFLITSIALIGLMSACGPSEEELQQREQARQDSLEQVRKDSIAQARQDSIEQARQDSIAAAEKQKQERETIAFTDDGPFAVQVGAWRSEGKAESQAAVWRDRGFEEAYVVRIGDESTGDIWFRVRLGRVASLEMAENLEEKLMDEYGEDAWISEAASGES